MSALTDTLAARLAADWYVQQVANQYAALYLWHLPSNGAEPGRLAIAEEAPGAGWEPSTARLSPALDPQQVSMQLRNVLRYLPILATEGDAEPVVERTVAP